MENKEKKTSETSIPYPVNKWRINYTLCDGCGDCVRACGPRAISLT